MIKSVISTVLFVILCVFLIGACVYPRYSFTRVCELVTIRLDKVRWGVETVNGLLDAKYWDTDYVTLLVDDVRLNIDLYIDILSQYIPYHLNKYDLYSRCTDKGNFFYSPWTNYCIVGWNDDDGYAIYSDNKCCLLECHLNDYNESESLEIIYDAFENKIMAMFVLIKSARQEQVYSCVEDVPVDWVNSQRPSPANEFRLTEVFDYANK